MTAELLAFEGVTSLRGDRQVLRGITLRVADGEVVALLGPSGAGKSTIVRLALGLMAPTRGVVRLRGQMASAGGTILVPPERRDLSVVFQDLALWPHLTVRENLAFVLSARHVPRAEAEERIASMLDRVDLAARAGAYPGELSGGEQQRVAIARALVTEPSAVLLDEPLASLDVTLRAELLALLSSLLGAGGTAALYVTHDPREAVRLARRLAVLERGEIVQDGTARELRAAPATPFVDRLLADLDGVEAP